MTVPDDEQVGRDGRGALRAHMSDAEPPRDLAARVRGSLESRGLVKSTAPRSRTWATRSALIAAGIVLGVVARGGYTQVRESRGVAEISVPADQYVLLLYGAPSGDTGVVHVAREREYGRWASTLDGGARWVGGNELHDVIAQLGGSPSASGTSAERLAGYFIIAAPSPQRATEVARTCPHLKYGGRVVVMTIAS